jgi:hypothetical protein
MFRSLLGYTVKPPSHEDSEKELAEVLDLFSKHSLYLEESEKRELKNEYDRRVSNMTEFFSFIDNIYNLPDFNMKFACITQ